MRRLRDAFVTTLLIVCLVLSTASFKGAGALAKVAFAVAKVAFVAVGHAIARGIAVALARSVTVYRGPSRDRRLCNLSAGDRVYVIERRGFWAKVRTSDGRVGWVRVSRLEGSRKVRQVAPRASDPEPARKKVELPAISRVYPSFGPSGRWVTIFGYGLDRTRGVWFATPGRTPVRVEFKVRSSTMMFVFIPRGVPSGGFLVQGAGARRTTTRAYLVREPPPSPPPAPPAAPAPVE